MNAHSLNQGFSPARLGYLLRNRLLGEVGLAAIGLAVVAANNVLGLFFAGKASFNHSMGLWSFVIGIGGILLSSGAFKDMHNGKSGTEWILLPASPLEKFGAALADYLLAFPLVAALVSMATSALFALVEKLVTGTWTGIWTPFTLGTLKDWGSYAVIVLLVMAGASRFRKAPLLKTLAVVAVFSLAVVIVFTLGSWLLLKGQGRLHLGMGDTGLFLNGEGLPAAAQKVLRLLGDLVCWVVLPLFSLGYGYLRVFEKEARDAVQ